MVPRQPASGGIDRYIAGFPPGVQRRLRQVRRLVKQTAPDAEEGFSYGIPGFRLQGVGLLSFAAWKHHLAIYPAPRGSARFNRQLQPYRGAKSTVRFPLDKPIPLELVAEIVRLRAKATLDRAKRKVQRQGPLR